MFLHHSAPLSFPPTCPRLTGTSGNLLFLIYINPTTSIVVRQYYISFYVHVHQVHPKRRTLFRSDFPNRDRPRNALDRHRRHQGRLRQTERRINPVARTTRRTPQAWRGRATHSRKRTWPELSRRFRPL